MKNSTRTLYLILLVTLLFVNWYYYNDTYHYLRSAAMEGALGSFVIKVAGLHYAKLLLIGSVFMFLALLNAGLSLFIVHIYFKKDIRITLFAAKILGVYVALLPSIGIMSDLFNQPYLFQSIQHAMAVLPSPFVEAVMIPLMKLYQRSLP